MRHASLALVLLAVSCNGGGPRPPSDVLAEPQAELATGVRLATLGFRETEFRVVRVNLETARIKMLWKSPTGTPYAALSAARDALGDDLVAVTNAGIYAGDHTPEGLFIENGRRLRDLNLESGVGNFYWKPNGVFYIAEGGAGIVEASDFPAIAERIVVREATQSGPVLVLHGEINSELPKDSTSRHVRNAIGIDSSGQVTIAISSEPVTLYELATFFKNDLACENALYLDGCVSQLFVPAQGLLLPESRPCEKALVGLIGVFNEP